MIRVGAAAPLRRFRRFENAGLESLAATADDWLTPCRITSRPTADGQVPRASLAATTLGDLKLAYAHTVGTELDVEYIQQESNYVVSFALNGRNEVSVGGSRSICAQRTAVMLSPQMVPDMRISDGYAQLHISVARHALERHLEKLTGTTITRPIRFDVEMDLSRPALVSWAAGVRLLVKDLDASEGLSHTPLGAEPWTDFVMSGLLLAQPHNYSDLLRPGDSAGFRPSSLHRAVRLIEDEPASDLSLARLCSEAGVGPRTLQRYFREYLNSSPREFVQKVRLEHAHEDLQRGAGPTVADVAFRWGFSHVSRFAGAYQERYGTPPSATLRAAP